ncbi:MAG: M15 family metallopeptidase [Labilithrix sp.]|nr:M15 family metallopeptidase [Labilithrix sp.]
MRARVFMVGITAAALVVACKRSAADEASDAALALTTARLDASAVLADAGAPAAKAAASSAKAATAAPAPTSPDPYGVAKTASRASCAVLGGKHVAERDLKTSFVDGDDLLAIVNRAPTGQLAPDYAPSDLVDIRNGKPLSASECERFQCLRREAASALDELLAQMKKEGFPGKVESAFRSYGNQCGTFGNWSRKSNFCEATEQSALPGHSQHQLGTTVDLFTEEWAKDPRGVFREGFGCTDAGRWLREHATDYGFVMPYPIHPDDRHPRQKCVARWDIPININPRTGYRFEHWHIRFVGKDAAARFTKALAASGVGTPHEISVEQWLRSEKGLVGPDAELPVCDGCNCGACSTLAAPGENACDKKGGALHLDAHGKPLVPSEAPSIEGVAKGKGRKWRGKVVEVKLDVPAGTITQTPIVGLDGAGYTTGATFDALAPYPETEPRAYAPLADAWVVAVEPAPNDTGVAWPYRAGIAPAITGQIYNRANVLLPARGGATTLRVPIPSGVRKAKVVLLRGGVAHGQERAVELD